jgi:hypothetical protein
MVQFVMCAIALNYEARNGEAPAEPYASPNFWLGRSLALPRISVQFATTEIQGCTHL